MAADPGGPSTWLTLLLIPIQSTRKVGPSPWCQMRSRSQQWYSSAKCSPSDQAGLELRRPTWGRSSSRPLCSDKAFLCLCSPHRWASTEVGPFPPRPGKTRPSPLPTYSLASSPWCTILIAPTLERFSWGYLQGRGRRLSHTFLARQLNTGSGRSEACLSVVDRIII